MPAGDEAPATGDYLGELRRTIPHLVALDGMHGGAEIAPIALRSFRRAQRILSEGRYVPAIERDLEAVTAELGELSGWLLFDAERQDQARAVNAEALNLAHCRRVTRLGRVAMSCIGCCRRWGWAARWSRRR